MENLALYRKYRPQRLSEVIGQNHITNTLANQVKSGNINHAYLFCGSRGVGKTTVARIFSKAINCLNPENGESCGECEICNELKKENLDIVEIDAASNNRVDEVRELREKAKFAPVSAKKKVYIIDEVHMLSDSAFNALLKTLEEPPAHVVFILATTEPQKLPATILSRCVRFDFKLLSNADLEGLLKKVFEDAKIESDEASIKLIADVAQGGARDCLSIADMCASFCDRKLTYEKVLSILGAIDKNVLVDLNESIISGDFENVFKIYNMLSTNGKGTNVLIKEMLTFYRDLMVIKKCANFESLVSLPTQIMKRMQTLAQNVSSQKIIEIIDALSKLEIECKNSLNATLLFEAFLIKATLSKRENVQPEIQTERQTQKAPALKTQTVSQQTSASEPESFFKVFGKLLTELKNQGYMALYGLLSEITNGKIENGYLIAFATDSSNISLATKEANKALINTIIKEVLNENLSFKIEVVAKQIKDEFQSLNNLLDGRLKIEE